MKRLGCPTAAWLGVAGLALGAAAGCESKPAAPATGQGVRAAAPAAAAPAAVPDGGTAVDADTKPAAPAYEYAYSPVGKRDPFRSVLADLAEGPRADNQPACTSPLCRWDLDQFRLVGVVSGMSNPLAMVEDPKGKGYILQRGTQIGKNAGKVTQIRPAEVVVTEIVRTTGKPVPNPIVLKLPADKAAPTDEDTDLMNVGGGTAQ